MTNVNHILWRISLIVVMFCAIFGIIFCLNIFPLTDLLVRIVNIINLIALSLLVYTSIKKVKDSKKTD